MPPFIDLTPRDAGPLQQEPAIEFQGSTDSHFIPECPISYLCFHTTAQCGYTSG